MHLSIDHLSSRESWLSGRVLPRMNVVVFEGHVGPTRLTDIGVKLVNSGEGAA